MPEHYHAYACAIAISYSDSDGFGVRVARGVCELGQLDACACTHMRVHAGRVNQWAHHRSSIQTSVQLVLLNTPGSVIQWRHNFVRPICKYKHMHAYTHMHTHTHPPTHQHPLPHTWFEEHERRLLAMHTRTLALRIFFVEVGCARDANELTQRNKKRIKKNNCRSSTDGRGG